MSICPICGNKHNNKTTCSKKCTGVYLNKKRHKESLCWTCKRAYAKPDPEGCAWIREHIKVWDKSLSKRLKSNYMGYEVHEVIECEHYVNSGRQEVEEEYGEDATG